LKFEKSRFTRLILKTHRH